MDDQTIIELLFQRDEAGLEETKRKYGNLCISIVQNILSNREDCDECINEAYYRIWNSIPPMRPDNLKAYLCQVARRTALDRYRFLHRKKRSAINVDLCIAELDSNKHESSDEESVVDSLLITSVINRFLESLKPAERIVFMQRYWLFENLKTISRQTGIKENTIKTMLRRLRQQLQQMLIEEGINR